MSASSPGPGRIVLVTGASGFIGGRLVSRLAAKGSSLRATSRRRPDDLPPGVTFVPADIAEQTAVETLVGGVGNVVNVAGQLGAPGVGFDQARRANADGPRLLLEAAARAGAARFVHVSTVGVLGDTGPCPAPEDAAPRPGSTYEITKLEGERAVVEGGARLGLPVTVLRPALVYGPGDRHLLPLFRAVGNPFFFHVDGGRALTHPVHVDDVVDAIIRAMDSPRPVTGVFHVAGEAPLTFRELIAAIARSMGHRPPRWSLPLGVARALAATAEAATRPFGLTPPLTRERLRAMTTDRAFDISRAREDLGWTPRRGLEEGLAETVAWYRAAGLL